MKFRGQRKARAQELLCGAAWRIKAARISTDSLAASVHQRDMDLETNRTQSVSIEGLHNLLGELRMLARRLLATESRAHSFTPTLLAMTALRRVKLKAA